MLRFQEVPRLEVKLIQLAKIQVDQDERAREVSDDTLALIGQYNEIIETISKTFLQYDSFIAAEEEKTLKKHWSVNATSCPWYSCILASF